MTPDVDREELATSFGDSEDGSVAELEKALIAAIAAAAPIAT
jgi:hypothetical protein